MPRYLAHTTEPYSRSLTISTQVLEEARIHAAEVSVDLRNYTNASHELVKTLGGMGLDLREDKKILARDKIHPIPALFPPQPSVEEKKAVRILLQPEVLLYSKIFREDNRLTLSEYIEGTLRGMNAIFTIGTSNPLVIVGPRGLREVGLALTPSPKPRST